MMVPWLDILDKNLGIWKYRNAKKHSVFDAEFEVRFV